ncbi:hypothetical protein DFH07DRAFT_1063525 [Mycena maculata]|uniref:Uncharacterized protein n=1 Tax=Mycena maculata TaxID=230809 RepID=A0AAD7IK71_9AGAR|nr:hypothetical protein DFH07DRAFT_1063525 [Mycena maculata]
MRRAGAICQGHAARVFTNPWGLTVRTYTGSTLRYAQRTVPKLPIPEASTAPLVESDFPQYLLPLYLYGWRMVVSRKQRRGTLARTFLFPNFKNVVSFTEITRDVLAGDMFIDPTLGENLVVSVSLHSPEGLTRSVIRSAVEAETEYLKLVSGVEMPSQATDGPFKVSSLGWLEALLAEQAAKSVPPPPDPVRVPIKPVPLPTVPPIPASPPPSVTTGDVKTYIAPLIKNGWAIRAVSPTHHGHGLSGLPSLARAYRFTTPSAARNFLHAAVALMPVSTPGTLAGVRIKTHSNWDQDIFKVFIWSISKLAPNAPFKYGISLADVCFAIDVDNEFYRNWVGCADNVVFPDRYIPKSAMDVWKFKARTFNSW